MQSTTPSPLVEPDVQISRIRLSRKLSPQRSTLARQKASLAEGQSQGLRRELFPNLAAGSSVGGLASKRNSLPLTPACLRPGPFAPRSLPASSLLWAGPTPARGRCQGYVFPCSVEGFPLRPAGPPRLLD